MKVLVTYYDGNETKVLYIDCDRFAGLGSELALYLAEAGEPYAQINTIQEIIEPGAPDAYYVWLGEDNELGISAVEPKDDPNYVKLPLIVFPSKIGRNVESTYGQR